MIFILLMLALYGVCALLVTGMIFAKCRSELLLGKPYFSWRQDAGGAYLMGIVMGLVGPFGVLIVWLGTGFAEKGCIIPLPIGYVRLGRKGLVTDRTRMDKYDKAS